MAALHNPVLLVGRLMLAFIFVIDGAQKVVHYEGIVGYMESYGVPGSLLPLVILTELGGGLLVALGLLTRLAALALAGFSLLTAVFFHSDFSNPDQVIQIYKNIAIAGGFVALAAAGPGALSLDALRKRAVVKS
jgi:putative oxidoreductase